MSTTRTYSLESYAVTEKDTTLCSRCNGLIVWQKSYRTGNRYPTDAKKFGEEVHTARNWFHECKKKEAQPSAQLPLLPEPPAEPEAKYEPKKQTKDEKRRAMVSYLEQASPRQLQTALEVIFNRQTFSEQEADNTFNKNSVGFNAFDAEILSDICKKATVYGGLRGGQVALVRKKMKHYSRQLVNAFETGEWKP